MFANDYIMDDICSKGTILGFGEQNIKDIDMNSISPKPYNPNLQCTEVKVTSLINCLNEKFIDTNKFCALGVKQHSDACQVLKKRIVHYS